MSALVTLAKARTVEDRLAILDWPAVERDLDAQGSAVIPGLLSPSECDAIAALYAQEAGFRSRVIMGRHGFGRGEYRYFAYPLPGLVQDLRTGLYPRLAPLANRWNALMGIGVRYPDTHGEFLDRCHQAGQVRPTPLLLQYGADDYNCLHQDLYGEHVFPLQVAILLSQPGRDFTGGEFVLTEQRPRMQSRPEVAPLTRGDALVFAAKPKRAPAPAAASAKPNAETSKPEAGPKTSTTALKWLFLAVAAGLVISTCLGLWMALFHGRRKGVAWGLFLAGAAVPVLILALL